MVIINNKNRNKVFLRVFLILFLAYEHSISWKLLLERPATSTSRIHILRLHPKSDGIHWVGCALNPVDIVNPHGYILGEVKKAKVKPQSLLFVIRFPADTVDLIQSMRDGNIDVEKTLEDCTQEAPSQCLTSHNFMRNKIGLQRIQPISWNCHSYTCRKASMS